MSNGNGVEWEDGLRNPPALVREIELSLEDKKRALERAIEDAQEMLTLMLPKGLQKLYEMLDSDDEQTILRAVDMIMSRRIPKVAALHTETDANTIESADTAALRDSILEEIRKGKGS